MKPDLFTKEFNSQRKKWNMDQENGELFCYKESQFDYIDFQPDTVNFLTSCGLPSETPPFLRFFADYDDFTTLKNSPSMKSKIIPKNILHYVIIGYTETHKICIDTKQKDRIIGVHVENLSTQFINQSLYHLFMCILKYRDFVLDINTKNMKYANKVGKASAYLCGIISTTQVNNLKKSLIEIDPKIDVKKYAMSFWLSNMQYLLDNISELKLDKVYPFRDKNK